MKRPFLLTAAALSVAGIARADSPAGYVRTWADEFDGTGLDSSLWEYRQPGVRNDAINTADAVSVSGGDLKITTYTANGQNYTGMIGTQNTFRQTYGYWEASIDFNGSAGMWSAFWLQSPTMGSPIGNPASAGTEMDIVEFRTNPTNGNVNNSAVHWDGYAGYHQSEANFQNNTALLTGYHTYSMLWTPGSMTYYVDGVATWTGSGAPVSQHSEYIILSSEVNSGSWAGNTPAGGYGTQQTSTTNMLVDYVRVSSAASYSLVRSDDFSSGTVTGWRGVAGLAGTGAATLTSGVTDTAFNAGTKGTSAANQTVMSVAGTPLAPTRAQIAFDPITLDRVGDSVIVSLDFRLVTTLTATDRRFYLGLFDSADGVNGKGYLAYSSLAKTSAGSYFTRLAESDTIAGTDAPGSGAQLASVAQYLGSDTGAVRSLQLTITKTGTGTLITFLFEDSTGVLRTISTADDTSAHTVFNTLSLNTWGGNGVNFNIDDVSIVYAAVPEPATCGLLGAGSLGLAALLRRRRLQPVPLIRRRPCAVSTARGDSPRG